MEIKKLPPEGKFSILGIDAGSRFCGISEQSLEYKVIDGNIYFKATLDDYYGLTIHSGTGWNEIDKIHFVHEFFIRHFPIAKDDRTYMGFIEEVPFIQNRKAFATLHKITGAIAGGLLYRGWNIKYINNSTWKSGILGENYGKGKKPDIMAWAVAGNLPVDPDSLSEDSLDAICIGYYGLRQIANQLSLQLLRRQQRELVSFSMEQ
jgi:Holliday junction resolvasome RuvABC endonuclease subunit